LSAVFSAALRGLWRCNGYKRAIKRHEYFKTALAVCHVVRPTAEQLTYRALVSRHLQLQGDKRRSFFRSAGLQQQHNSAAAGAAAAAAVGRERLIR